MSNPDSPAASDSRSVRIGALVTAVIVLLCGVVIVFVQMGQPADGRIVGRCFDSITHEPRSGEVVDIERQAGPRYDEAMNPASDTYDPDYYPSAAAPSGWAQGSDADSNDSLFGNSVEPKSHWRAVTRADGSFVFPRVPVGYYSIWDEDAPSDDGPPRNVLVADGSSPEVDLAVAPAQPSLEFNTPAINWLPGETPDLVLNGTSKATQIAYRIDRVDPEWALANLPALLVQPSQESADATYSEVVTDPDERVDNFALMRNWTAPIAHDDPDSDDFVERVHFADSSGKPMAPGLYRVAAAIQDRNGEMSATTWVRITRLAVIAKTGPKSVLIETVDMATGQVDPNATAALYGDGSSGKPMQSLHVDSTGAATFSTAHASGETAAVLIARDGDSAAGVTLNLNSPGYAGDSGDSDTGPDLTSLPPLRAFVYTDRPVYRPGQTVEAKGIMRRFTGAGFAIPAGQAVSIEVRDPDDTIIYHGKLVTSAMGTWTTSFALSDETLTGDYSLSADIGGQTVDDSFLVAAYHKPEYSAKIAFDKDRYVRGDTIHMTVSASYYYGAPVIGAKANVDVFSGASPDGDEDSEGSMNRDNRNVDGEPVLSEQVVLGADGTAEIDVPTNKTQSEDTQNGGGPDAAPLTGTDETYNVNVTVDDGSGTTEDASGETTVAPGEFDLRVSASANSCGEGVPVETTIAATNPDDSPKKHQPVSVSAYYDDWTDNVEHKNPLSNAAVTTDAFGSAILTIRPQREGTVVVEARTVDSRGDVITAEDEIWVGGIGGDLPAHYAGLSLVLDRKKYAPGDTARLLINTAHPGPAVVIGIEGEKLYAHMVIPLAHHTTEVDIPVALAYAPSVAISATCIYDKQSLSDSARLTIDDPRRPLDIAVTADRASYHPGDPAAISISTKDAAGKPVSAEVSVGVVDTAVYAIAPEDTRDIVEAMEPEQGNAIDTTTSCETVFYGDVDKGSTTVDIRRKFPDTALWRPDVVTDASGKAVVRLTMPDNLTTWRVTCVGVTAATQVGRGTADMRVAKDLVARLEMPHFLVSGDRSQITVIANNSTSAPLAASLSLSAPGLAVSSPIVDSTTASAGTPAVSSWPVVAGAPGSSPVTAIARARLHNDGVEEPLPIEPHGLTTSTWNSGAVDPRGPGRVSVPISMPASAIPGVSMARIRLTPTLASAIVPAVQYLAAYPCGSADTVSDVLTADAVASAAASGSPPAVPLPADQVATLRDMTKRSIVRLAHLQEGDGSWSWFATDQADLEITSDALWALIVARKAGYNVDSKVLSQGADAVARMYGEKRGSWRKRYWNITSYPMAALEMESLGRPDVGGEMIDYQRTYARRYPLYVDMTDRAIMAMAEQAAGGKRAEQARDDMAWLWSVAREAGGTYSWTRDWHRGQQGVTEDRPDADTTAWAILAAESITPDDPRVQGACRWLIMNRNDDHWSDCPYTTADCIEALTAYLGRSRELSPNFTATVTVNGRSFGTFTFNHGSILDPAPLIEVPASSIAPGASNVVIAAKGTGVCYYSVEDRVCTPIGPPEEFSWIRYALKRLQHLQGAPPLPEAQSGYRMKRVYIRLTSRRNFLMEDTTPTPDTHYNVGEDIAVRLIVDCTRPGSRLAVSEPIPAGCTITDVSGDEDEDWNNWWDYTDVRDDRVVFYIADLPRGRHEIDYHLHAQTPGRYDAMPTTVTSMIDPTLQATGEENRITIDSPEMRGE
jgi:hypothetical protein